MWWVISIIQCKMFNLMNIINVHMTKYLYTFIRVDIDLIINRKTSNKYYKHKWKYLKTTSSQPLYIYCPFYIYYSRHTLVSAPIYSFGTVVYTFFVLFAVNLFLSTWISSWRYYIYYIQYRKKLYLL